MQNDDLHPPFWIWEGGQVLLGLHVKCQFTYSSSATARFMVGCEVVLTASPLVSQIPGCWGRTGAQTDMTTLSTYAFRSALCCSRAAGFSYPSGATLGYRKTVGVSMGKKGHAYCRAYCYHLRFARTSCTRGWECNFAFLTFQYFGKQVRNKCGWDAAAWYFYWQKRAMVLQTGKSKGCVRRRWGEREYEL